MNARNSSSRTIALGAKFSQHEADKIRSHALSSGTTVSTILHDLAIKGQVLPRPKIDPIAIEQWRTLAPLAANLNQLSRAINQGQIPVSSDVSDGLFRLRGTLREIRNALIGEERDAA